MKLVNIIMVLLLILLISGCKQWMPEKAKPVEGLGTEGLAISFTTMPEKLYSGQAFDIPIDLENKGKIDVENAILTISGYNDDYLTVPVTKIDNINVKGVTEFTKIGEKTTEIFRVTETEIPGREYDANLVATACYQYRTEASPTVCINPKLATGGINVRYECTENEFTLATQGSPVMVTKVVVLYYDFPNINFRIYVEDKGPGRVKANEAYAKECIGPALTIEDLEKVEIKAFLGEDEIEECSKDGFTTTTDSFQLKRGKGDIECRVRVNEREPAYTTPLTVVLKYGYSVSISKLVKISNR